MLNASFWDGKFDHLDDTITRDDFVTNSVCDTHICSTSFIPDYIEKYAKHSWDTRREGIAKEFSAYCKNNKIDIWDYDVYMPDTDDFDDCLSIADVDREIDTLRKGFIDAFIELFTSNVIPVYSIVEGESKLLFFDEYEDLYIIFKPSEKEMPFLFALYKAFNEFVAEY